MAPSKFGVLRWLGRLLFPWHERATGEPGGLGETSQLEHVRERQQRILRRLQEELDVTERHGEH